jgi:O-antigen ligase
VRVQEVEKAWDRFLEYPLLGLGEASYHSISIQDIFGPNFSPTDIGLLGVALQYGVVGLLLYLFFGLWIFVSFLRLLMSYREHIEPRQRRFLWILLTMCFAYLIVSPLQRPFIEIPDLAVVAFSWGLLLAHKHGLPGGLGVNRTGLQSPTPLHHRAKSVAYSGQNRPRR